MMAVRMRCSARRVLSAGQKEAKIKELVEQAVAAKANAPCKALKRRVFQRARKKLAHLLTQEEFEIAVERLKQFDEEAEFSPPAAHPSEISRPPPQAPLCMPLRIIAVPLFVPVMPAQAIHQEAAPLGSPSSTPEYEAVDQPSASHGGFMLPLPPVEEAETPTAARYFTLGESSKVAPLTFASDSEIPTPRAVYYQRQDSPVSSPRRTDQNSEVQASPRDLQLEEYEAPIWSRSFTEGYCMPIKRTFIQFNTCEHVGHRRSRSV
ncbi:unnamed protein product [Symbiodinium sp. CCMP2592]|nr:unnamed protein product [Symbiodinium sp. CCMP2592]